VTGGAGFIGSQYVRMLLGGDLPGTGKPQVTVLDKLTYAGNLANLEPVTGHRGLTFVHGDIGDAGLLASLLPRQDAVVNFAAETHVDRSIAGAGAFVETNVLGVQVLLEACLRAGVARVIQVSTDEVYGSVSQGSWAEGAALEPNSPYAASKAGGDMIARAYAQTHGLPVCITRCCNNYGPYQFPEKVIPLFITNLLDRRRVPLYGDGRNVRHWVHAEDHCRGIQLVLEQGAAGGVYHIGGDRELSNLELTEAILGCCGSGWDMVEHVQDRKGHDLRYALDDSLLRGLGYAPRIGFEQGLATTMRWYRENRHWWEPLKRAAAHRDGGGAGLAGLTAQGQDGRGP
jgi:dTDP-glucose 4,6-dehydratase